MGCNETDGWMDEQVDLMSICVEMNIGFGMADVVVRPVMAWGIV